VDECQPIAKIKDGLSKPNAKMKDGLMKASPSLNEKWADEYKPIVSIVK
jgi:hypothetical protein